MDPARLNLLLTLSAKVLWLAVDRTLPVLPRLKILLPNLDVIETRLPGSWNESEQEVEAKKTFECDLQMLHKTLISTLQQIPTVRTNNIDTSLYKFKLFKLRSMCMSTHI